MKNILLVSAGFALSFIFGFTLNNTEENKGESTTHIELSDKKVEDLKLGAFSISLNVKDLNVSKEFYEKLGFNVLGGKIEHNYLIMKNENAIVGLFQGFFEGNILTFNPGWDENGQNIDVFNDIREIQEHVKAGGIVIDNEIDPKTSGPASFIITDPDNNTIYFDQHR